MVISIRMLGGFQIAADEDVVLDAGWRPAKAAAIIKILALRPEKMLHRDQLIDLLWPEADQEAGTSSFYKNLHHLRSALRAKGAPDLVVLHRGAVSLTPDATLDVDEFRGLARRALASHDVELFEHALATQGGDLLPGDLYEPWTEPHREELRALRLSLQLGLAERQLRRRCYEDAIHHYHEALATSALAEEAWRGLMRAYAASGQGELALAQYERCREVLRAELETDPATETQSLAAELRRVGRLSSPIDDAITAPVQAAQAAMRRRDWDVALARYREAISSLHAAGGDDQREAELCLAMSVASSARAAGQDAADFARRAAQLAQRAGDRDLESRALVQFQAAADVLPNNHPGHRESAELIGAALDRCPPEASVIRARLLAASARPFTAGAREGDERHVTGRTAIAGGPDPAIEARLREALALARDAGNDEVLTYAISRLRLYITSPDTLDERLGLTGELAGMLERLPNPVSEFEAHLLRHEDLLESGDLDGARIEARAIKRIGDALGLAGVSATGLSCLATHATADGDLREGMSQLFESRKADASYGDNANSQYRFGVQFLMIRWHQGRAGELYEPLRRAVDLAPRLGAPRASLALVCAETGRLDEARRHMAHLTGPSVAGVPRDYLWWLTAVFLGRVAVLTSDNQVARELYEMMLPFEGRNASTSGAASYGSAALHLAQLAQFLGDAQAAARHYERALEFNTRTRQRTWAAHTRRLFAGLLAEGSHPADRARASDLARMAAADAREIGLPPGGDSTA